MGINCAASARATMTCNGLAVSGIFQFDTNADLISFTANRYFGTDDKAPLEKWVVETTGFKDFNCIRIANKSKVIWKLNTGEFIWAHFELTDLEFNNLQVYGTVKTRVFIEVKHPVAFQGQW